MGNARNLVCEAGSQADWLMKRSPKKTANWLMGSFLAWTERVALAKTFRRAIHRAAGPELAAACAALAPCPTGEARLTPGFNLPARYVIHAVGPRWQGGHLGEAELLASAYRACLDLCERHTLRHIAFPAISTGIYSYPLRDATQVAVDTVRAWAAQEQRVLEQVIFTCFDDTTLAAYRNAGVNVSA